jgi:hypothetical protein
LDLFSGYFGSNSDFVEDLGKSISINVRASNNNNTRNEPSGDWVMETDNIDIKNIYFKSSISE